MAFPIDYSKTGRRNENKGVAWFKGIKTKDELFCLFFNWIVRREKERLEREKTYMKCQINHFPLNLIRKRGRESWPLDTEGWTQLTFKHLILQPHFLLSSSLLNYHHYSYYDMYLFVTINISYDLICSIYHCYLLFQTIGNVYKTLETHLNSVVYFG